MSGGWKMLLLLMVISPFFGTSRAWAQPSAEAIIAKADQARGNVEGIEWTADIESVERHRKQQRTLIIRHRDDNNLAEFTSPRKVKGRKLLMKDRNMWFIKPGLRKPVPISPRQKLIGGAANGDIASTDYAGDYDAVLLGEEKIDDQLCYLFELTAIDGKVTYDRIHYWVSKDRNVAVKADFYTVSGKLFKSARFEHENWINVNGEKLPFVSRMIISNALVEDDVTTMTYSAVVVKPIPLAAFNLNLLVRH